MHRITLNVLDSVYDEFKQYFSKFKKNEIETISEEFAAEITDKNHPIFLKNRVELHETLRKIDSGETTLISMEEFEASLDKIIAKYEVQKN
jgi:hypothetical protein